MHCHRHRRHAMTDQLQRAWSLLTDDERPEGFYFCHNTLMRGVPGAGVGLGGYAGYAVLCQAVEGVLLKTGFSVYCHNDDYSWDFGDVEASNPDRLTAACDALEAERGKG